MIKTNYVIFHNKYNESLYLLSHNTIHSLVPVLDIHWFFYFLHTLFFISLHTLFFISLHTHNVSIQFIHSLPDHHILPRAAPAGEFTQCFSRFLNFFPFLFAVLLPATVCVSFKFLSCLQAPGMKSQLTFSGRSSCWLWSPGYLILIKFCRTTQALMMIFTVLRLCCMVISRTWKQWAKMPKTFSTTLRAQDSL